MKNNKKKVIISTFDDRKNPFYGGGGSLSIHEIARRIVGEYDVTIITANYPEAIDENIEGINYKRYGLPFMGAKLGQLLWHIVLPFIIMSSDFDIWIESFTPPFSTSCLPLFTKKPVIGLVHMLAAVDMTRKYKLPFSLIENIGLRFYKNLIVLTETSKEKIKKVNRKADVRVIANGVNLPKKESKRVGDIVYLGRIEVNQKGLDLLLKAFKRVSTQSKSNLLIAGSGAKREVMALKKMIHKLNLTGRVKYIGRIEGKVKDKFYKEAGFSVLPSRYETFSMVALESFSYGLPIVCFDIKGLSWFDESCSIKVKQFDVDELASKILRLSKDNKLKDRLGRNGRKMAKQYSWDLISKRYIEMINHVFEKGKETEK